MLPAFKLNDVGDTVTPVTGVLTVTEQVLLILVPSVVLTVIVAVPFPTAVTTPLALTVATLVFDDDQDKVGYETDEGVLVTVNVSVAPLFNVVEVLLILNAVVLIGLQVIVHFKSFAY